jgi:acetyl-CoA acetyltransferase
MGRPGTDVYVVGVGMTRFGIHMERDIRDLCEEAFFEAMQDAGAYPDDIEVGYLGTVGFAWDAPIMAGQIAFEQVGVTGIPITRVENACGSGSNAIREAWLAIKSGEYDVALASGVETMNRPLQDQIPRFAMFGGGDAMMEGTMGLFPPGIFAMVAQQFLNAGWITREDMAIVAVKNAYQGSLNPKAHYQRTLTMEQVLNARMICYPLGLLDCCPTTDGAAAVILCSEEALPRFRKHAPVRIRALSQTSGTYCDDNPREFTADSIVRAAKKAYEKADVTPEDIDFVECHDCFTMAEIVHTIDLGFCEKEEVGRFVREGNTQMDGKIPFSVSGGLMSKGHPLGATGPGQYHEVVTQLRGERWRFPSRGYGDCVCLNPREG